MEQPANLLSSVESQMRYGLTEIGSKFLRAKRLVHQMAGEKKRRHS